MEHMEKDRQEMKESIVGEVKEELVRTLKICLSQKDVEKISKEFEKNTKLQSMKKNSGMSLMEVMDDVKIQNNPPMAKKSSSEDNLSLVNPSCSFVKPKFMKVKNPPSPSRNAPPTPTPSHMLFEKEYIRNKEVIAKKFEKKYEREKKILERQKRKAANIDVNKKYLGFGEVFDPVQAKLQKKAEKKLEREERRKRILKKANVTKEEKDLMNELLASAESNSSSGFATSPSASEIEVSATSQSNSSLLLESSGLSSVNSSFSLDSSSSFNISKCYDYNQEVNKSNTIENLNAFEFSSCSRSLDLSKCEDYHVDDLEDLLSM